MEHRSPGKFLRLRLISTSEIKDLFTFTNSKNNKLMKYLSFLMLIACLYGCKNRNIQDSKKIDIEGIDLYITGIFGPGKESISMPAYKINLSAGRYALSLDVNSCNGTYRIKGNEIKFNDDQSCTKICCDSQDAQSLRSFLKTNFQIKKDGENIILMSAEQGIVLSKTVPKKTSALVGKKYLVSKAFGMGNEYKPDFAMSVEFSESGYELQLNANNCSGLCEISDDQIKFGNSSSCTEKCCDSDLAIAIRAMFKGTMQYVIDAENPVIFDKNFRIWLVPYVDKKDNQSSLNAQELIGSDYKIKELSILPKGPESKGPVNMNLTFDYILSFKESGIGLKLDVNSCNSSADYSANSIEIGSAWGCSKMCCDSKESTELKGYMKGKFYLKNNGNELIVTNDEVSLRLVKL